MMRGTDKILFIVPAYNEASSVGSTVEEIIRLYPTADVVVIDDGSIDATAQVTAAAGAKALVLPFNLGIGAAVQTGFKFAAEFGYLFVVRVDGDGQHDPQYAADLLGPILAGEADVATGSRFLPPNTGYRSSFIRRIGINFFAGLLSRLTAAKITDPTSGFQAFNAKAIGVFAAYYPDDFPEPEAIAVMSRYGLRLREVPVRMRQRSTGVSSIRYLKTFYYMVKVTCAILLDKLKRRANEA
ncbi:MAG: glycosyltransferase family 2 protein [Candidatus Omnitrophica bacterium]|nr:glycosyltransferase family 2 protein [Candidatus Omnitrophota bacterium]